MEHKFTIAIEETIVQEFEVCANDATEALEKAKKNYRIGKYVLEPGEVCFKQIAIVNPCDGASEWTEF